MAGGGVCVFADPQSASSCRFTVNRFNRCESGTVARRIAVRAYRALGYLRCHPARPGAIVEIRRLFVRSRKEIAGILRPGCLFESLAQGSGQPFRGELRPARSDRPPSALISRIRSRQDSVRRAADLGRKAMMSPLPSARGTLKAQKHTRIGFSLWATTDPVAAGPAMWPGSFHEGGGRRVQD